MCSHIPDRGEQMVRYYGYYSNVSRGPTDSKNNRGRRCDREDPQASWPLGLKGQTPAQHDVILRKDFPSDN